MNKEELNKKYYELAAEIDDIRKQIREIEHEEEAQAKASLVGKFFKERGEYQPELFMRVLDFSEVNYPAFEIVMFSFDDRNWRIAHQDVDLLDWAEITQAEYIESVGYFINLLKHDLLRGLE